MASYHTLTCRIVYFFNNSIRLNLQLTKLGNVSLVCVLVCMYLCVCVFMCTCVFYIVMSSLCTIGFACTLVDVRHYVIAPVCCRAAREASRGSGT